MPLFGQLSSLSQVGLDVRRHVGSDRMLDVDLGRRERGEVLVVAEGGRDSVEGKQSDQPSSVFEAIWRKKKGMGRTHIQKALSINSCRWYDISPPFSLMYLVAGPAAALELVENLFLNSCTSKTNMRFSSQ